MLGLDAYIDKEMQDLESSNRSKLERTLDVIQKRCELYYGPNASSPSGLTPLGIFAVNVVSLK
jgi:hypothetical protein